MLQTYQPPWKTMISLWLWTWHTLHKYWCLHACWFFVLGCWVLQPRWSCFIRAGEEAQQCKTLALVVGPGCFSSSGCFLQGGYFSVNVMRLVYLSLLLSGPQLLWHSCAFILSLEVSLCWFLRDVQELYTHIGALCHLWRSSRACPCEGRGMMHRALVLAAHWNVLLLPLLF